MINRLRPYLGEPEENGPEENGPAEDYWELSGESGWYCVSRETALELSRQLERLRPPRWLRFQDLFGAEVRLRSSDVDRVSECTAAQRAAVRKLRRALRQEEKADRHPWEDDD